MNKKFLKKTFAIFLAFSFLLSNGAMLVPQNVEAVITNGETNGEWRDSSECTAVDCDTSDGTKEQIWYEETCDYICPTFQFEASREICPKDENDYTSTDSNKDYKKKVSKELRYADKITETFGPIGVVYGEKSKDLNHCHRPTAQSLGVPNWAKSTYNQLNELEDFIEINCLMTATERTREVDCYDADIIPCDSNGDEPEVSVTIYAHKIICEDEMYLPNWGTVKADGNPIALTTAQTFLNDVNNEAGREVCWLESGWDFQWGFQDKSGSDGVDKLSGDYIGPADGTSSSCAANCGSNTNTGTDYNDWRNFDSSTGDDSPAQVVINDLENAPGIWIRENLKEGYIPFTYPPDDGTENNVSAEIYCYQDVYKYDNYDLIESPELGETYYCVAFNAPKKSDVTVCKHDDQGNGLEGWQVALVSEESIDEPTSINVSNGSGTDSTSLPVGYYLIKVSGNYKYGSSKMIADAGYSYRPLGIPDGCDCWFSGFDLSSDSDGLMAWINGSPVYWGPYIDSHDYTAIYHHEIAGPVNISIHDDNYSDNLNNDFKFEIFPIDFQGTTRETGCVIFSGVPYGSYLLDEENRFDWINLSGLDQVIVDNPEKTFEIVNTHIENGNDICSSSSDDWGLLDKVDIGNVSSEFYHSISGWSEANISGGYGGCQNGEECTYRQVLGESGGIQCTEEERDAIVILHAGDNEINKLIIRHLDGISLLDSFDVYVNEQKVGHFNDDTQQSTEVWRDIEFDISSYNFSGDLTIKIVATDNIWSSCGTYGQVSIDFIEIYGCGSSWEPHCGDGFCDDNESCETCPDDCGQCSGEERSAEITSPTVGEIIFSSVSLKANLYDDDYDDLVRWAVRKGNCNSSADTVLGNVDGFDNDYTWVSNVFHAESDVSTWEPGEYCFVFNPTEGDGESDIRLTRLFNIPKEGQEAGSIEICKYKDNDPYGGQKGEEDTILVGWTGGITGPNDYDEDWETTETGCVTISNLEFGGPYTVTEDLSGYWEQMYPANGGNGSHSINLNDQNPDQSVYFLNYNGVPTTYSCDPSTRQCSLDSNGQFGSEQGCLDACGATSGVGGQYVSTGVVLGESVVRGEEGIVAGASCVPYLYEYIKYGANNNPFEVKKLQAFLNGYLGLNLDVSGIYDQETYEAVKRFQDMLKYDILSPWVDNGCLPSENIATGYVYRTTKWAINNMFCPSPKPDISDEKCYLGDHIGLADNLNGQVLGESLVLGEEEALPEEILLDSTENEESLGNSEEGLITEGMEENEDPLAQGVIVALLTVLALGGLAYIVFRGKMA